MNEPKLMFMKRITIYGILLLMALTMQAQTSAKAKERVAEVRKLYAAAKERMAQNDREENPARSGMETTFYYMVPGAGPTKHHIHYYFGEEENDEGETTAFTPYFITVSYNVAARNFYEEYLIDEKTEKLIFAYYHAPEFDGSKSETRYYYYKDGEVAHQDVKGENYHDAVFSTRIVHDFLEAFHHILHIDY